MMRTRLGRFVFFFPFLAIVYGLVGWFFHYAFGWRLDWWFGILWSLLIAISWALWPPGGLRVSR
jgi:hypothetical protein